MKILIGTPVHEIKDYAMERWMKSIKQFTYPYDLLLIDNTVGTGYVSRLENYCKTFGIKNYTIKHIEIEPQYDIDERVARSREVIREHILSLDYDAWCTLECDVVAPPNALEILIELLKGYWAVSHAYPCRHDVNDTNIEFGIALVKRVALEKEGFLLQYGHVDPLAPTCWHGSERWFKKRLIRDGGSYHDVYGIIKPIFHLAT